VFIVWDGLWALVDTVSIVIISTAIIIIIIICLVNIFIWDLVFVAPRLGIIGIIITSPKNFSVFWDFIFSLGAREVTYRKRVIMPDENVITITKGSHLVEISLYTISVATMDVTNRVIEIEMGLVILVTITITISIEEIFLAYF